MCHLHEPWQTQFAACADLTTCAQLLPMRCSGGSAGLADHRGQVWQLTEELNRGPVQGSARLRQALAEVADGVRSVAEADLRNLIRRERLPAAMLNPRLYADEAFLASPDAWWPQAGVAAEVDSREWHLSPRDRERTLARHSRMSAFGIIVLHYPPRKLRAEPHVVAAEIRSALEVGQDRQLAHTRTLPAR